MSAPEQDNPFSDFSGLHLWNMPARTAGHPGFHMPGHAGARLFTGDYAGTLLSIDTTELSSSDDLHRPTGPARLAMCESSRIYNSGETLFVTTGSTTGIQVMLASVASHETFLLLPRTVHTAVLNIISLLHLQYAFIPYPETENSTCYLYPQLTAPVLLHALTLYPQTTDILLTSPDYYGQCADLPALAKAAHSHGCRLLVDEAHGSHFAFAQEHFPSDAMESHADMCVQSLHKTLPALTMASQIHISKQAISCGRISVPRVWEMLRVFETSSPSFLIAASAEYALAWMNKLGAKALNDRILDIQNFTDRVGEVLGEQNVHFCSSRRFDPMHLVVCVDPGRAFAPELMNSLAKRGIHIEFADLMRMVLIVSPWQTKNDFDVLFEAVKNCVSSSGPSHISSSGVIEADRLWGKVLTGIPERVMAPGQVLLGKRKRTGIDLLHSEGRICSCAISPLPPGIPLLWPGEIISKAHINVLKKLYDLKIAVCGMNNGRIDVLEEKINYGEDDIVGL